MNPRDVGKWLAGKDEYERCEDESFAETLVYGYKYAMDDNFDGEITKEDMDNIEEIMEWWMRCVCEIVTYEECCPDAWWKEAV